jgi:hypothetical protein
MNIAMVGERFPKQTIDVLFLGNRHNASSSFLIAKRGFGIALSQHSWRFNDFSF